MNVTIDMESLFFIYGVFIGSYSVPGPFDLYVAYQPFPLHGLAAAADFA